MDIKNYIKEKAKKIGIDTIGFADAGKLKVKDFLQEKRKAGDWTSFEEEDLNLRTDPSLSMEGVQSIIVIGVSYNSGFKPKKQYRLNGKLSMSSWGLDYHKVLANKMDMLVKKIKVERDFTYKCFVDTGPLVDRELARKAGIGFFGKNCSIINKEFGSYIFIGYILTSIKLEPDRPIEDECGDCDICLRSCPTGALEGEYYINPNKCISYLTQTKDIIPKDLRKKMGKNIYGCDVCQKVCPRNKDVKTTGNKDFIPEITGGVLDLEELLFISNRNFKKKFRSMAGSWRGRNTLKRNAIIGIGNMKDEKNIPLLLKSRENSNSELQAYIDDAIERIEK